MARTFAILDYAIFSITLVISLLIGVYFACFGSKQKTNNEFLMASRKMSILPVSMSILATFHSAIMILGMTSEIYYRGQYVIPVILTPFIYITITAELFMPIFFKLKLISLYEYLERRFKSKFLRIMTSVLFILQMLLYMAVVVYAPAIALNSVTGLSTWVSVVLMGTVGTIYTAIGGLRAVMWTDTFQMIVMCVGILSIIVQGSINLGGLNVAFEKTYEGGRLIVMDYDQNPFMYQNLLALIVGGSFYSLSFYATNQAQIQRYSSMKSVREAKIALYINIPMMLFSYVLVSISAYIIYATYMDCDLMQAKIIPITDAIMPYYVMETLYIVPGIPGLLVSSLFCGSLSTISSGLNSIAAVVWEDILRVKFTFLSEAKKTYITKSLVLIFGMIVLGLTFITSLFNRVVQASIVLNGIVNGPIFGIFIMALFISCCNYKGAICGALVGMAITTWIAIGAQVYGQLEGGLPTSTSNCTQFLDTNATISDYDYEAIYNTTRVDESVVELTGIKYLYKLSMFWRVAAGSIVTVIVGIFVSVVTGRTKLDDIEPELLSPLVLKYRCRSKTNKYSKSDSPELIRLHRFDERPLTVIRKTYKLKTDFSSIL